MSPAATAKAKHDDLWMVFSIDKGFYTARGWHRSADFALLFTKPEVDQFISEQADDVLVPIRYDPGVAHNDTIRVIGRKTEGGQNHDLNKVALAALNELESHHGPSNLRVEVIRHDSATVPESQRLTGLVQLAVRELQRSRKPVEFPPRFDRALENFDIALEGFKRRSALTRHIEVME